MRIGKAWIFGLLVAAVLGGIGTYAYHVANRVLVLRVATGPAGSFGAKFAVAVVHLVSLEHPRVRVRITNMASDADALKALTSDAADIAVARADAAGPIGQTIAVLKHDAGIFVLPHAAKADSVAALRGLTIGIVGSSPDGDARLLDTVRKEYGLPDQPAAVHLAPEDVAAALHGKKIQAVFMVASAGGSVAPQTLAAFRSAGGGQPHLLPVDEATALVKRNHILESVDWPKGVLQGQPPLPDDDISTIGVSTRLFGSTALPDAVAAEVTRMLLADKPRVASLMPPGALIEAPETDKLNASLPVHSGTAAYLSGNQPSISDEAQNALYWLGLIGSLLASTTAAIVALVQRFMPRRPEATLKLLDLWVAVRQAGRDELDAIEGQVDDLVQDAVRKQARGKGDDINPAFPLIVDQVKRAVDRRRQDLNAAIRPA